MRDVIKSTIVLLFVVLGLQLAGSVYAAARPARFDPACLPWQQARYQAEKLFLGVDLSIAATLLERPPLDALRAVDGRKALMPTGETLALRVQTQGPGWRTVEGDLLLDARSGSIFQSAAERQPSPRYRVYRFTSSGPERFTARPFDAEIDEPRERWTDTDVRQRTYAVGSVAEPVLDVTTLLYLLAASELGATGDFLTVNGYATSAEELFAVTASVGRKVRLPVDYRVASPGTSSSRRAVIDALPIRVAAESLKPASDTQGFDIMGLYDVEFLLDPERRVIAALRARVPAVGSVQFQLKSVELKPTLPSRCQADRDRS